jgi:hypothetical protein
MPKNVDCFTRVTCFRPRPICVTRCDDALCEGAFQYAIRDLIMRQWRGATDRRSEEVGNFGIQHPSVLVSHSTLLALFERSLWKRSDLLAGSPFSPRRGQMLRTNLDRWSLGVVSL